MATDNAYEYTPIVTPKTIRLLHLHPGAPDDPVSLTLVTTSLDDVPEFEAISYCWGQSLKERQVTCNGAILTITNSLFSGLVYFRHVDRPRILWADAICINQADATEKCGQVLLMPHIYSQATRAMAWLGEANDPEFGCVPSDVAASIKQALQLLPEFDPESVMDLATKSLALQLESQRLHDEGKPNLMDHDWTPLATLLKRPWFRRKWVVQEITLAKEAVLHVGGGVQIPWLELAKLAFTIEEMALQRITSHAIGTTALAPVVRAIHCVACILMVQQFRFSGTLLDGVACTMCFDCTDPRDLVYSLCSLGAIGPTILPDYNASFNEVCQRFAIAMLMEGQSLKLLSLAPKRSSVRRLDPPRVEGLPSWVPDLQLNGSDVMAAYTVRPQGYFAGGHAKPVISLSDDERVLGCQGRIVDTVKTVSMSMAEMLFAELPELRDAVVIDRFSERMKERLGQWIDVCYQTAFGHPINSDTATTPDEESLSAFSRTMVCDMDVSRNRLPAEWISAFTKYILRARENGENAQDGNWKDPASMPGYWTVLYDGSWGFPAVLRFCATEGGRLGRVPLDTQPGDRICVLVGGEIPFIARPTGRGTYSLIGESYLDGIMDGEVFAAQDANEPEFLETIYFE